MITVAKEIERLEAELSRRPTLVGNSEMPARYLRLLRSGGTRLTVAQRSELTRDLHRAAAGPGLLPEIAVALAVLCCPAAALLLALGPIAAWLSMLFSPLLAWKSDAFCRRWLQWRRDTAAFRLDARLPTG